MKDIYMLSDGEIIRRIADKIRELRLKQNISQSELAERAGLSLLSVVRAEEGGIKKIDTLVRLLRILGRLEAFTSLIEEEQISPAEYFKLMNANKEKSRQRATKRVRTVKGEEQW